MAYRAWQQDASAPLTDQLIDLRADIAASVDAAVGDLAVKLPAALSGLSGPVAVVVRWSIDPHAEITPGAVDLVASVGCATVGVAGYDTA